MSSRVEERVITVALAGQPNVGKSQIFNTLTGLAQHVANWPGKTSEQRTGTYRHDGVTMQVVDLPGTYSLTANSGEERLVRDYILKNRPDVVALIVDASALERNLYLLAELLYLPVPVVVALNMLDVAEGQGVHIEPHVLQAALGLPVVSMTATRNQGLREFVDTVGWMARHAITYAPSRPQIRDDHAEVLLRIRRLINGTVPVPYPEDWVALKLLEGDDEITELMRGRLGERWEDVHATLRRHDDAFLAVAGGRYEWIARMVRAAVTRPRGGQITRTDRVDRVATHPIGGLALLFGVLGAIFWLTYSVGTPLQQWMDVHLVQGSAQWVRAALSSGPPWLAGLLADGLIGGIGMVLTFLPVLLVFFAALGFLEDIGYIARAAYVTDRFMHALGLHGRSFLPLFLGFGCNVPSITAARTIDSPKARLLTILLAPLVPCPARMTVVAVLTPVFFGPYAPWVAMGVLGFSLAVLALAGFILHESFGNEHVAFIMELPLYHTPSLRSIARSVWERLLDFLKVAGTTILVVSGVLWALSFFPNGDIGSSYLASAGRLLAPAGALLGLGWQMMVALVTSLIRKENIIATLAVLYGSGRDGMHFDQAIRASLSPASALAFLVVQMLFVPCIATLATIQRETRSWRWTLFSVLLLLVLSWAAGLGVYHLARLLGL